MSATLAPPAPIDKAHQPQPIANALAELETAASPHERRDRIVESFRAIIRTLGGLALAAWLATDDDAHAISDSARAKLARLRRQALTDGEWVGLTRELLRPWRELPDTHPLPALVRLFHGRHTVLATLDELLGMRKRETVAHGSTGSAAEVDAIVHARWPQLVELVDALAPLWISARLAVVVEAPPHADADADADAPRAHLLHGPSPLRERWTEVAITAGAASPGELVVLDPDGGVRLALSPAAIFARPSPDQLADVFWMDGADRHAAVYVSFPYIYELRRPDVWQPFDRALATDAGDAAAIVRVTRPYRGLEAFGPEHAELFVGREALVDEVANRVRRHPWVTVTGASGSGKTSLVLAGLLPSLANSVDRERIAFRGVSGPTANRGYLAIVLRPGPAPLEALRHACERALDGLALAAEPARWASQVTTWAMERGRVIVVVVDQAEELLTLCHDAAMRDAFARVLVALGLSADGPSRVVLVVREDFVVRLGAIGTLGDRIAHAVQLVQTPSRAALLQILRAPARLFGGAFEPDLAEAMVDAVADQPAALAMLSFVADRLWDSREPGGMMTHAAYDAAGGVIGALAQHADAIVQRLGPSYREAARALFLRLVTADGTREVTTRATLDSAIGEQAGKLIEAFAHGRLLAVSEGDDGDARIEIAHELLLSRWQQLQTWRDEDREAVRHLAELRTAATAWRARGRARDGLWRGSLLAAHRAIADRTQLVVSADERAFVTASVRAASRARRIAVGVTAVVVAAITVAAGIAVVQRRTAEQRATEARDARDTAEQRRLASEHQRASLLVQRAAAELVAGDAAHAAPLLDAAIAIGAVDEPVPALESQIAAALPAQRWQQPIALATGSNTPDPVLEIADDGSVVRVDARAFDGATGGATSAPLVTTALAALPTALPPGVDDPSHTGLAWTSRNQRFAAIAVDGANEQWALPAQLRAKTSACSPRDNDVFGVIGVADADGTVVAICEEQTSSRGQTIERWRPGDAKPAELLSTIAHHYGPTVASPDARVIAALDTVVGRVELIDGTRTNELPALGELTAIAIDATGSIVAVGDAAGDVQLWDVAHAREVARVHANGPVAQLAMSAHGTRLAVLDATGKLGVWDRAAELDVARVDGGGTSVVLAHTADGVAWATHADDRLVIGNERSARAGTLELPPRAVVERVAISRDLHVAAVLRDGTLVADQVATTKLEAPGGLSFARDGSTLIAGNELFDLSRGVDAGELSTAQAPECRLPRTGLAVCASESKGEAERRQLESFAVPPLASLAPAHHEEWARIGQALDVDKHPDPSVEGTGAVRAFTVTPTHAYVGGCAKELDVMRVEDRHYERPVVLDRSQCAEAIAVTETGHVGAVAFDGGGIAIWDLQTNRVLMTIATPATASFELADDGHYIAIGSKQGVDVWHIATRQQVFHRDVPGVLEVALSRDGTAVFARTADAVWRVPWRAAVTDRGWRTRGAYALDADDRVVDKPRAATPTPATP